MKQFFTGDVIKAELLVMMLEKHGIEARHELLDPQADPADLAAQAHVFVDEAEYDRAWQLFYAERQDEL